MSEDGDLRADQLRQIAGSLDVSLNVPLSVDTEGDEWQDRLLDTSPDPESLLLEASDREREKTPCERPCCAVPARDSGEPLFTVEHEVRSAPHPMSMQPMVNRNPALNNRNYAYGQDQSFWAMEPDRYEG